MCHSKYLCKGPVIKLADATIILKKAHSHNANDNNFSSNEIKKMFRNILLDRAKLEINPSKLIYDEESIR